MKAASRSRSTEEPSPTVPFGEMSQTVRLVSGAFAPLNRADTRGHPWKYSWGAGGGDAQARPVISEASAISRHSRLERAQALQAQTSCGHLTAGELEEKVAALDRRVARSIRRGDDGVEAEVVASEGRSLGESQQYGELAAIVVESAMQQRLHRRHRRKMEDAIFLLSDKCDDHFTVVALSWRWEEATIC